MRDFNERDARGRSLLYVAARAADLAAVKRALILVNAETASARTVSGKTALFAAARGGCREIVEILAKRADADPNARAPETGAPRCGPRATTATSKPPPRWSRTERTRPSRTRPDEPRSWPRAPRARGRARGSC